MMKQIISQTKTGKRFRIYKNIGLPLAMFSFFIQKIIGINRKSPYLTHYTSTICCGQKIKVEGDDSSIRSSMLASGGCYVNACNGLTIGEGTIWSANVVIVSLDHDPYKYSNDPDPGSGVAIGRNCWIGANSTILPGVTLGDHTIVGANTVVTKSFPEGYVVIAGTPAKVIKSLNKEKLCAE